MQVYTVGLKDLFTEIHTSTNWYFSELAQVLQNSHQRSYNITSLNYVRFVISELYSTG